MKEEPNKSELEVINRMMDQLENEIKKKRDQKTLSDPEMFLTYMNRALETYSLVCEELGNCLYVIGMQNHFLATRKLFRLAQQQINSVLKFSLRYFVKRSDEIERDQKLPSEQYNFYANLKMQELKMPSNDNISGISPEPRGSLIKVEDVKGLNQAPLSPTKKSDQYNRSNPQNSNNNFNKKSSPIRSTTKIDIATAQTISSIDSKSDRQAQLTGASSKHSHHQGHHDHHHDHHHGHHHGHHHASHSTQLTHSNFKFKQDYESSQYNKTQGTDEDNDEEEKDQIEYEKMKKEIDQFLQKKNNIDHMSSAGTANELKHVLRQLEITRKKARNITEEEEDDVNMHEANIAEITDGALGAFAMAQKKTAKKVIRHIDQKKIVEEIIQSKIKTTESATNTDDVMKQILREMYQSELDPAFDKLHREIGHLENRIKIREEEIDKLNLKLIEAIKVHHGCSDEKNQLELKLGSLRNDNDKLMQNLNSATALLREMGAKDTNLTEISDKTISEKENRTKEEIESYKRRIKGQEKKIEELEAKLQDLMQSREEDNIDAQDEEIYYEEEEGEEEENHGDERLNTESTLMNNPSLSPSKLSHISIKSRDDLAPSQNDRKSPGKTDKKEVSKPEPEKKAKEPEKPKENPKSNLPEKKGTESKHQSNKPSGVTASNRPSAQPSAQPSGYNTPAHNSKTDLDNATSKKGSTESVHIKNPPSQISVSENRSPIQESPVPSMHNSISPTPVDTPTRLNRKLREDQGRGSAELRPSILTKNKPMLNETPVLQDIRQTPEVATPTQQQRPEPPKEKPVQKSLDNSPYLPSQPKKNDNRMTKSERVSEKSVADKPRESDKPNEKLPQSQFQPKPQAQQQPQAQAQNKKPEPAPVQKKQEPTPAIKTKEPAPVQKKQEPSPRKKEFSPSNDMIANNLKPAKEEAKVTIDESSAERKEKVIIKKVVQKPERQVSKLEDPVPVESKGDLDGESKTPKVIIKKKPKMMSKGIQTDIIFSERNTPEDKKRIENPDENKVVVKLGPNKAREKPPNYHFSEFDSSEEQGDEWSLDNSRKVKQHHKLNSTYASPQYEAIIEEKLEDTPKKLIKSTTNLKMPKRNEFRSIPKLKNELEPFGVPEEYIYNDPQTQKMAKTHSTSIFQARTFSKTPKGIIPESYSSPSEDEELRVRPPHKVVSNRMVRKLQEQIRKEEYLELQVPEKEPDTKRLMYRAMLKQAQIDPHLLHLFKRDRERDKDKEKKEGDTEEDEEDIVDFDRFENFVNRLVDNHNRCGPNCVHLMRFFTKIGFWAGMQNRKTFELKSGAIWDAPAKKRHRQRLPMIPRRKPKIIPSMPSMNST